MGVTGITSSFAGYVTRVTGSGSPQGAASTKPSPAAAALQESTETPDVTAKEARAGDKVAIRKIARQRSKAQTTTGDSSSNNRLNRVA